MPINAGDPVWVENKAWTGLFLNPYNDRWLGVTEPFGWIFENTI